MSCCNIFEKFDVKNNLIKEYEHWVLVVRKNHVCLGSCVAITKRHHDLLGDLSSEEMSEYQKVALDVESALKDSFQFEVIHHLLLMVKDKHTHFHIIPWYKTEKTFANVKWIDDLKEVPLGKHNMVSQNVLDEIRDEIKSKIS